MKNKQSRNSSLVATKKLQFLTFSAKKAFHRLRQAFIKAPILQHFDPKSYIWIKTNTLGYAIVGVLNQQLNESTTLNFG